MNEITGKILDFFDQINAIPRCSRHEAELRQWLQDWADTHQWLSKRDVCGNLLIYIPATKGYEASPTIVLQGHMDMVCEKTPDSTHDFAKDPILSRLDGEWLHACDTTLGADNGIALAYVMALAEASSVVHPPLELLFTVDEESGLNGAKKLEPDFIDGKILVNLDSEDEGVFTVGCAGGLDTTLTLDLEMAPLSADGRLYKLVVGGLRGGHSGIDIHKHRANANKILARALAGIRNVAQMQIFALDGGTRHNAIPRDAKAVISLESTGIGAAEKAVEQMLSVLKEEYDGREPEMFLALLATEEPDFKQQALTTEDTDRTIQILLALPDGVAGMSPAFPEQVETSSNLATVSIADGKLSILCSQRSSTISRLENQSARIHAVAGLAGASAKDANKYPAWPANMASPLLKRSINVYQNLFKQPPTVQVIHAGLECAILGDVYAGMDMISFGPTIRYPHSPGERLYIPSVEKVWRFLVALLKDFCDDAE